MDDRSDRSVFRWDEILIKRDVSMCTHCFNLNCFPISKPTMDNKHFQLVILILLYEKNFWESDTRILLLIIFNVFLDEYSVIDATHLIDTHNSLVTFWSLNVKMMTKTFKRVRIFQQKWLSI